MPSTGGTSARQARLQPETTAVQKAWYSVADAANHYCVSTKTIRRRIKDGSLRIKMVGGLIRISAEALAALAR